MRVKNNYIAGGAISVFVILIFAIACVKKPPEQTAFTGIPFGLQVDLPREVKNAEEEPAVLKESAVIVSVPNEKRFFVGPEPVMEIELDDQISQLLKGQAEGNRIVYVAGGALVDYGDLVIALDNARKESVFRIGLLVEPESRISNVPSLLRVQIPAKPDPNEDLRLKPNPQTLVVSLSHDLQMKLNGQPMGEATDTTELTQMLTRLFQQRKELRAYKPGMETRTDVSEDERLEKTIVMKAGRSSRYGDVVRLIDAIKGAGANPIILQLDDLPE